MKLIPLIAALVFAQATKTSVQESQTAREPARLRLHPLSQESVARAANLQFTVDDISDARRGCARCFRRRIAHSCEEVCQRIPRELSHSARRDPGRSPTSVRTSRFSNTLHHRSRRTNQKSADGPDIDGRG